METVAEESPELPRIGPHLALARKERGLTQVELAEVCGLAQQQVSFIEAGRRQPTLDQLLRIAKALDLSIQRLLGGSDRPGTGRKDIAIELLCLGMADLWVKDATVPGAFRRPEEVVALAVSGREPDPRIIEAIPAVLAWNRINPTLLKAYGLLTKTTRRLAWLADIALAIEKQGGFPGGCRKEPLLRFLKTIPLPTAGTACDGLGKPVDGSPTSPLWRRWKISYDADASQFRDRAALLEPLRGPRRTRTKRTVTRSFASSKRSTKS